MKNLMILNMRKNIYFSKLKASYLMEIFSNMEIMLYKNYQD